MKPIISHVLGTSLFLLQLSCSTPKSDADEQASSSIEESTQESATMVAAPAGVPKNIMDYYFLLRQIGLVDDYYTFVKRDGQWLCLEDMGSEFDYSGDLTGLRKYHTEVDIENGHIRIVDDGTGGGDLTIDLTLFRTSDINYTVEVDKFSDGEGIFTSYPPEYFRLSDGELIKVTSDISEPKNILDYYYLLRWKKKIDPFVFVQRSNEWIGLEELGEDFDYGGSLDAVRHYPVVVDIKNGYIKIEDEGTGGGTSFTELALFRKSDKSYIIAMNQYGQDDPTGIKSGSAPQFYSWQNYHFNEVTQEVFPEVPESAFFKENETAVESQKYFTLPQVGRSINYFIQISKAASSDILKHDKIEIQFDSKSDKFVVIN